MVGAKNLAVPCSRRYPLEDPGVEHGMVQFDHLLHWVPDLDAAVRDYQAVGFTVQRAGQHPQFGTHNAHPAASAAWLAGVFALDVVRIAQDAVTVPLPGSAITFAPGLADRITAVILTGPGAPKGSVAGLRYLDAGPATSHPPV
jgi:hypothetical protein